MAGRGWKIFVQITTALKYVAFIDWIHMLFFSSINNWLVVWLPFFIFPWINWVSNHPNWRTHIFSEGWPWPTNQIMIRDSNSPIRQTNAIWQCFSAPTLFLVKYSGRWWGLLFLSQESRLEPSSIMVAEDFEACSTGSWFGQWKLIPWIGAFDMNLP